MHRKARTGAVIQPFPTFCEIYVAALKALHNTITGGRQPGGARLGS